MTTVAFVWPSLVELIPHFIPVIGLLDGAILVPFGILAAINLVPPGIMAEHRAAAALAAERPVSRGTAVVTGVVWLASLALAAWFGYRNYAA
ncbi:hypothetical protein LIG30_2353 [Burkholderia sp. lig30]|jgi:uncharacterized membrane protein YkvA (DUF1232 family)|uniref:hypothetical protein n=1 Tax=Burkholderia sp. lig30 TaxID=1192124 RepID=UPI0004615D1E|nr:hypothetical protein [Burkholderia sp. lig30]KDB08554.1 hypothetical protein LIG30_2353 [Burkholderia sp. lig30]